MNRFLPILIGCLYLFLQVYKMDAATRKDSILSVEIIRERANGKLKVRRLLLNKTVHVKLLDGREFRKTMIEPHDAEHVKIDGEIIPLKNILYIKGKTKRSRNQAIVGGIIVFLLVVLSIIAVISLLISFLFLAAFLSIFGADVELGSSFLLILLVPIIGVPLLFSKRRFSRLNGWIFRVRRRSMT